MLDFFIKTIEDSIGTADFYIWTDKFLSFLNGADNGISPDLAQRLCDIDPNNFIEDHKSYVDMLKKVRDVYCKRSPDVHTDDTHLMPAGMSMVDNKWYLERKFRVVPLPKNPHTSDIHTMPVSDHECGDTYKSLGMSLDDPDWFVEHGFVVEGRFDPNKKSKTTKSAKQHVFDEAMSMLRDGKMDDSQKRIWEKVAQFKKGRNQ